MIFLGIETSCDDTCVAVVERGKKVLVNERATQEEYHKSFLGVVPEIASRRHLEVILETLEKALKTASLTLAAIDGIGVTIRPGLLGSLRVGVNVAKALSLAQNIPLVGVNHLLAHLYSPALTLALPYPHMGLVVSGGHTLLTKVESPLYADILGSTLDDACGEAFDKIAKFFSLGYPGGPLVEQHAKGGDEDAFAFPISLINDPKHKYCFSYSGLKTAVIHQPKKYQKKPKVSRKDLLASFQKAAIMPLYRQVKNAVDYFGIKNVCIGGGVSANGFLRNLFLADKTTNVFFPNLSYCTDNAAMVAGLAYVQHKKSSTKKGLEVLANSLNFKKETFLKA